MAVRVGGIEFSIKVSATSAVEAVRSVQKSLRDLGSQASSTGAQLTGTEKELEELARAARLAANEAVDAANVRRLAAAKATGEEKKQAVEAARVAQEVARIQIKAAQDAEAVLRAVRRQRKKEEAEAAREAKKNAKEQKEAARDAAKAARDLAKEQKKAAKEAKKANDEAAKAAEEATKKLQSNFLKAGAAFAGVATGVAAASASLARSLSNVVVESTLLAGRVEALGTVLRQVGGNAGYSAAQIDAVEETVKKLGITTQAARQSLAQLAQANLDLTRSAQLTRIAQDAAVIAGVDSSEAFNRLVVSIQRNDVRLLRNLGIVINLNTVYDKFAKQTGRTAQSLTALEKQQLLLNEVLTRGQDIAGTYEAAMGDVFKRFTSLNRKIEESQRVFGEEFLPIFELVVDTTDKLATAFVEGNFASELQSLAVGGVAAVAVFTPLAAIVAALSVAAVAVGAAIAAFGVAILPVVAAGAALAAALLAVAAGIAAVAGGFVAAVVLTRNWTEEIRQAGIEGAKTAQQLSDISRSAQTIDNLARSGNRSAEAMAILNAEVEKVAQSAPELAVALRKAADAGNFREVLRIIQEEFPQALDSTTEQIADFSKQQAESAIRVREGLVALGFSLEEADIIMARSIKRTGDYSEVLAVAAERLDEMAGGFILSDSFTEFQLGITDTGERVRDAAAEFQNLKNRVEALKEVSATAELQQLQSLIDDTRNASAQAALQLKQLQTEEKKGFTEAERQLRRFQELTASANASRRASIEDINRLAELQIEQEKQRAKERLDEALKEADTDKKRTSARVKNELALDGRIRQIRETAKQDIKDLSVSEKLFAEAIALSTEQIEENTRALDERAERLRFLAEGLEPNLLRIRERAAKQAAENVAAEKRLLKELADAYEERNRRIASLNAQVAAGQITFAELAADKELAQIEQSIEQIRGVLKNARRERLLDEQDFGLQIEREKKKQFDNLLEQEEDALNKLAELRGEVNLNSLEQVTKAAEDQQAALKKADEFIVKVSQRLADQATPGIRAVEDAFSDFSDAVASAASSEQLDALAQLFPDEVASRVKNATKELENARNALKKFETETRPAKEREQRIARQKRFNELVDAGVNVEAARREQQEQELKDRQALNAEEQKLNEKKTEQERIAQELKALQDDVTAQLQQEIEVRRQAVTETLDFEARRLELQQQQTAELEKQVETIRMQRQALAEATGSAVPPGAMVPTARTPQTVQQDAEARAEQQALQDEVNRFGAADQEFTEKQKEFLSGVLDIVRQAGDGREQNVGAINEALTALAKIQTESKQGARTLKTRM